MIPKPSVVTLPNGNDVGVYEYGDPAGRPVMTFHGIPACGAGFAWADEPARARGLRVIAPDRPGVGRSTPLDDWSVRDWPAIVADLANTMQVDHYAVWGYSGGGPYAVATAAAQPDRVVALAVAAGMGEVGTFATIDDFEKTDRQFTKMAANHPRVARFLLGTTARLARLSPKSAVKSFEKQLTASDAKVAATLGEPREVMALFTEAFSHGARGVVDDYRSIGHTWGVDFASISVPVRIFQGTADTMVPLRHAEALAGRIPKAELVRWPDEGHLGTITHVTEILDWVRSQFA